MGGKERKRLTIFKKITQIWKLHVYTLTLALLDVGVDLVQSSYWDLSDLRVEQELHQGGGDVFTGWHAGCLGHFTLRERET